MGNRVKLLLIGAVLAAASTPLLPLAANGCSCATPADLQEWVGQSEAVFVGSLVDKRDAGVGEFGNESIYVFEVEEWIKGDAGDVIEVHSASDGAGCGFEFYEADQRLGAAIHMEAGVLRGGLCSQIDADVALVLEHGLPISETGTPRLLVSNGWDSPRLTLLDAEGGHVTDLLPPDPVEFEGTHLLESCPGGDRVVQVTGSQVIVWDTVTFEPVAVHETGAGAQWGSDVSCRDEEASSIWLLSASDVGSRLLEVNGGPKTLFELPGTNGWIGTGYVLSQSGPEGAITWIDVDTGEKTAIAAVPPGDLWSLSAAPHPTQPVAALMETHFDQDDTSTTLSIVDRTGTRSWSIELSVEAYAPTWLDEKRLLVTGYDWEVSETPLGMVIDTDSGEVMELGSWNSFHNFADGQLVFGVDGGSVVMADLRTGAVEILATLPVLNAGPLLALDEAAPLEIPTTTTSPVAQPTVPPLGALEAGPTSDPKSDLSAHAPWVAGGAMIGFFGILAWLALGRPRAGDPES